MNALIRNRSNDILHALRQIPVHPYGLNKHRWLGVINGQNPEMLASLFRELRIVFAGSANPRRDLPILMQAFILNVIRGETPQQFEEAADFMVLTRARDQVHQEVENTSNNCPQE